MTSDGPILITGAEGFVGGALRERIMETWPESRVVGSTRSLQNVSDSETTIKLDLGRDELVEALGRLSPSLVFHLAARSSVGESLDTAWLTFSDNVGSCLALARAMREATPGVPLVFASSGEVYGASFNVAAPISETEPPTPQNAYARSKLASEFALTDILEAVSPVVILRLFNHFGPAQDERFVVSAFASQIRRMREPGGERRLKVGNLDPIRDFLPVADVLDAYIAAAILARRATPGANVYNVGSGQGRSIRSVLADLLRLSGLDVEIHVDPSRVRRSDIPRAVGDPAKFIAATNWKPRAHWDDALAAML
jgi:GDP-4-dehydro-6-deoxy-D-mannose reductase